MAGKIKTAMKRPPLQKNTGKTGHNKIRKFTWDDSAKQVVKIYEEVIEKAKSRES